MLKPRKFTIHSHHFWMLPVTGDTFCMGSKKDDPDAYSWEQPAHKVELNTFYLSQYPVTQALWLAVMELEKEEDIPFYFTGAHRPAERVSWDAVQLFIKKLLAATDQPFRLPTEAEWEFAARGGIYNLNHKYAGSNRLKEVAWYNLNSHGESKSAGRKYPNELGLFDMSGNVWEWCEDWFGGSEYYQECKEKGLVVNPVGPEQGSTHVSRGGSWSNRPRDCRAALRGYGRPGNRNFNLGFRLALSLQSET
ncbi:MAG: formylglycine-generating enzyme family protein [Saprospiraceae bacterium]